MLNIFHEFIGLFVLLLRAVDLINLPAYWCDCSFDI